MVKSKNLFISIACIVLSCAMLFGLSVYMFLPRSDIGYNSLESTANAEVSDTWQTMTWTGLTSFQGFHVWSDGTNVFYSNGSQGQYVLDTSTNTWAIKSWNISNSFIFANYIWFDGTNYHLDTGTTHKLYFANIGWNNYSWTGLTDFYGNNVWSDGISFYYSNGTSQYVLDLSTRTWTAINWNGIPSNLLSNFVGSRVWSDGTNYYLSNGSNVQYLIDTSTYTLSSYTYNFAPSGQYIWSDSTNIYYSNGSNQWYLISNTNGNLTWGNYSWYGLTSFDGYDIWHVGDNYYYSNSATQYYTTIVQQSNPISLPCLTFDYPNNTQVVSTQYSDGPYRIYSVSLYPRLDNNVLSFTSDSYIEIINASFTRYRFKCVVDFVINQSYESSLPLSSLSNVTDVRFSPFSSSQFTSFTMGTGTDGINTYNLISFSAYNTASEFVPTNYNISVTDGPGLDYRKNNIMYSDTTGNMLVIYLYYVGNNTPFYIPAVEYSIINGGSTDYQNGYNTGYSAGYTAGETDGLSQGYQNGYTSGQSVGYNNGYSAGQTAGYNTGYSAGYTDGESAGFNDGVESASNYSFLSLIGAVVDAPLEAVFGHYDSTNNEYIGGLFSFDVFGVSSRSIIFGLLTISIALIIVRLVLKGGN